MKVRESNGRYYVNALTFESPGIEQLGVIAVHRHSGKEVYLDCILPDDRFTTVCKVVREVLGKDYSPYESFPIVDATDLHSSKAA